MNLETETVNREIIESRSCEFPSLHPNKVGREYRYVYMAAAHRETENAPLQAFVKVDLETGKEQLWSAAPRGFASEPIFVPHPNATSEDNGWILGLIYDSEHQRSDVIVLDAKNLILVAKLHLKHHVPYGLHGNFVDKVFI